MAVVTALSFRAQLRRATGISQRKAAADLQVSQALLSHYEKGIREPGLDFVVRAADYYHVSCDLLLGRRDTVRQSELLRAAAPSQYARETERDIRKAAPGATVTRGLAIHGSHVDEAAPALTRWVKEMQ